MVWLGMCGMRLWSGLSWGSGWGTALLRGGPSDKSPSCQGLNLASIPSTEKLGQFKRAVNAFILV